MGLNYAYEIIAPRALASRLFEALAPHLVPEDAARVLESVRRAEAPEQLTALARCKDDLPGEEICLCFLFPEEPGMAKCGVDAHSDPVTGRVAIGCVWTSLQCGERFVLLRGCAATSDMSRLFESSASIRAVFSQIGSEAGALAVTFDEEDWEVIGVWPASQRMGASIVDEAVSDPETGALWIDGYCEVVLEACGLSSKQGR